MTYEWDPAKRAGNLLKHGLSFEDAWRVFEHPVRLDVVLPDVRGETRRLAVAAFGPPRVVAVLIYTVRGDAVRCISFRRASRKEREDYREYLEALGSAHE